MNDTARAIPAPLKLKAKDAEDLQVISALLQDSIVPVCDMAWQPEEKTFLMALQRLYPEPQGDRLPHERRCCAVRVRGVEAAQTHRIDLSAPDTILELLMIGIEGQTLRLIFAGEAEVRLNVADWSVWVEDFGAPWPASCTPCHEEDGQ